jgi:sugar O-acyltransferase (sialic acid O-acetyltransferase NeuD family)
MGGRLCDLLIAGAGGFSRETAEAVRAINAVRPTWNLLGFLDDDRARHGKLVDGTPVLGPIELVHEHPHAQIVLTTGRPGDYASRRRIADRLGLDAERYASIVHPAASVGTTCEVGAGTVLLAHADLTAGVVVGRHVAIMPQVVVPHDVRVADFATLTSGVRLGGGCRIGEGAYLGAGTCVREGLEVGAWAMVGMSSVVTRHVPAMRVWWGSPARDKGQAPVASVLPEAA